MSYLGAGAGAPVSREQLELLCELFGLPLPGEDAQALTSALRDQLVAIEQLDRLRLDDLEPAHSFDPRWRDINA